MLKSVFLAGSMMIAAPVFAQDAPNKQAAPQTTQSVPATTDQSAPQPAMPADSTPAAPASDPTAAQDSTTTAAQPAATGTQVADVVNKEFASYDKNRDGVLSPKEFDTWMLALKTASDPTTKPASAATKTWLNQAFAQADTDKNRKVSKTELTGFLSAQG